MVFDQFSTVLGDSRDKMKSRNTSRIQFSVGSGTVGHVAWTLQPLICSRGNESERGSTVPNVPKRIYTMWSAAIFSAMIALCDGDSGQKKTTIIGRFGHRTHPIFIYGPSFWVSPQSRDMSCPTG